MYTKDFEPKMVEVDKTDKTSEVEITLKGRARSECNAAKARPAEHSHTSRMPSAAYASSHKAAAAVPSAAKAIPASSSCSS